MAVPVRQLSAACSRLTRTDLRPELVSRALPVIHCAISRQLASLLVSALIRDGWNAVSTAKAELHAQMRGAPGERA